MAAPMILPYATLTVKCKDGWKKGMGLKIADTLEMEACDVAGEDVHAVAQDDKKDGEYGSVYVGGVIPIRVINAAGDAGDNMIVAATGYFAEEAGAAAANAKRIAVTFDDYDHDATATTEGLVTALVQVGNFHKA